MTDLERREAALKMEIESRFPQGTLLDVLFIWQLAGNPESEAASPNQLDIRLIPQGPKEYDAFAAEMPSRGKIPEDVYNRVVDDFWKAYKPSLAQLGKDLKGSASERIRIFASYGGYMQGWVIVEPPLTPVMARLDSTDLETLDALIAAGCAPNRADAIRWALARVRERPAYQKLVDRVREVQALRAEL
jgi:hypothetical protein